MQELLTGISTVGFPIVAFIMMWYQSTKTIKENTKVLGELCLAIKQSK